MGNSSFGEQGLPPEVLSALGSELAAAFETWAHRLPPDLLLLARRVIVEERPNENFSPPHAFAFDSNLYDAETLRVLDEAFHRAWSDLQSVNHPASREAVAKCLCHLVRTERQPARLATKAVVRTILPSSQGPA